MYHGIVDKRVSHFGGSEYYFFDIENDDGSKTVVFIGKESDYEVGGHYILPIENISNLTKNEYTAADYKLGNNKLYKDLQLLVFDLDGTIIDSNPSLRNKTAYFNDSDYDVPLIKGFLNLKNYLQKTWLKSKWLLISNRPIDYINNMIKHHKELLNLFATENIFSSASSSGATKLFTLYDYCKSHDIRANEVLAFGDEEKDALIYTELGFNFLIADEKNGYSETNNISDYIKSHVVLSNNAKNSFRYNWMYDIITTKNFEFTSTYIEDIVVYYKHFHLRAPNEDYFCQCGRKNCGLWDTYYGNDKSQYILEHIDNIIKNFSDINLSDSDIAVKVPGSKELFYDVMNSMSIVLNKYAYTQTRGKVHPDFLLRQEAVEQAHGKHEHKVDRTPEKHLSSIIINPSYPKNYLFGKTVYLFDDIATKGASLIGCSELLYNAGAAHVVCIVLARTGPNESYPLKIFDATVLRSNPL